MLFWDIVLDRNIPNWTNSKGFAQVEEIVEGRIPGSLRIAAVGESTTQGFPQRSYPFFLSQILRNVSIEYQGVSRGFKRWCEWLG